MRFKPDRWLAHGAWSILVLSEQNLNRSCLPDPHFLLHFDHGVQSKSTGAFAVSHTGNEIHSSLWNYRFSIKKSIFLNFRLYLRRFLVCSLHFLRGKSIAYDDKLYLQHSLDIWLHRQLLQIYSCPMLSNMVRPDRVYLHIRVTLPDHLLYWDQKTEIN